MSTNRKNISISRNGFTLVEMVIIAPIVILLIGGFISAIVSMTGAVIASRASSSLAINIQDALNRIDVDVKASTSLLSINSIKPLTTPQGYNDDMTDFTNVGANGTMLIISTNATTGNPLNASSNTVYWSGQPNACNSASVTSNTPVTINIVYFVKNNSLWRRTILPSGYSGFSCVNGVLGQPWQRSSCAVSTGSDPCKTQDEKLLTWTNSGSFAVDYFTSTDTVNPIAAANTGNDPVARQAAIKTASTVKANISATSTVAGRDVTQSGNIRAAKMNNIQITGPALSNSGGGSWAYKRQIAITNGSGGTLTNYQVKISLTTATLGSPYTHFKADGSDVRFTDSNGITEYSYWIESWTNIGTSIIWVNIPSLTTSGATINMYYGNPSAIASSNGTNTFDFYENAETYTNGQQNPGGWGLATTGGGTGSTYYVKAVSKAGTMNIDVGGSDGTCDTATNFTSIAQKAVNLGSGTYSISYKYILYYQSYGGLVFVKSYLDGTQLQSANPAETGSSTSLAWANNTYSSFTNSFSGPVTNLKLGSTFNNLGCGAPEVVFDNIYIRKYTATEPTHTAPGAETAP